MLHPCEDVTRKWSGDPIFAQGFLQNANIISCQYFNELPLNFGHLDAEL